VIAEYLYLVGCPFAIVPPMFEGVDDCQEFLVVDFVVDFRWLELSGIEGHWMQSSLVVPLREYRSNGKVRGISFDYYRCLGIKVS